MIPQARRAAPFGDAREALAQALDERRPPGAVRLVEVAVPAARGEALIGALPEAPAHFWSPPEGPATVGLGAAHVIELDGPARFSRLRAEASALFARVIPSHAAPRLYGGFAFAPGAARGAVWREFSDGRFTLPRWSYCTDGRLTLAIGEDSERDATLAEAERILAAIAHAGAVEPAGRVAAWSSQMPLDQWSWLVDQIRAAIGSGRFEKIVAARLGRVAATRPFDAAEVLARLVPVADGCTRFAFRPGATTFVGATPERLVARRGHEVLSEALAGSIAIDHADELMKSQKDLGEHALVVREIVRALAPRCRELVATPSPEVRPLRHVLHLHTPIRGELIADTHVLELVEALHPTPAVGGVPTPGAIAWIVEHEAAPRGWYAAPVGWFDAAGDGEFCVALRCGVLDGAEAAIYAGAGIMGDSSAELEYAETALKQRALASALGVVG